MIEPRCTLCPLHENALSVRIDGRGEGSTLVVGMNPGSREDMAGEVFVGPTGQLLDELLSDAGFEPEDVRLTNAIRCYNGETKISDEHLKACRRYLREEILERKPAVIIALGDWALRALTRKSGISKARGTALALHASFEYECQVWPTYHPAFILNGSPWARDTIIADLRRVRDRDRSPLELPWRLSDTAPIGEVIAWDIETIDHEANTVDEPTMLSIAGRRNVAIGESVAFPVLALSLCELEDDYAAIVTHNGWRFDVPKMHAHGYPVPWGEDTMVLAFLDDENQPLGLESLAVKYLRVPGWKSDTFAPLGSNELRDYAARDAAITRALWGVLRERLGPRARIASEIILPALHALDGIEARGLYVDPNAVARGKAMYEHMRDDARARIAEMGPERFNPNSTPQVLKVMRARGHAIKATDAGVLLGLDDPLAHAIVDFRRANKKLSTYLEEYEEIARTGDGRAHGKYHLYRRDRGAEGTVVGRTSSSGPNMQNVPREFAEKGIALFAAPPGRVLVYGDYGQMHVRLAAELAGESRMLENYAADEHWDGHSWFRDFADELGVKITRQVAKSANFSQLYCGDGGTLVDYLAKEGLTIPLRTAAQVHTAWHLAFPAFRRWYARTRAFLLEYGYSETPTGLRRHFGSPENLRNMEGSRAFEANLREAVNFQVIGYEAHIAQLALGEAHHMGLELVHFVHDSIGVECDEADVERTERDLHYAMVDYPAQRLKDVFGITLDVPLVVDFKTVKGVAPIAA